MGICKCSGRKFINIISSVKEGFETARTDGRDKPENKFITSFDGARTSSSSVETSGSTPPESSTKGRYAFIGGIGFGIIAIFFIYIIPHNTQVMGLTAVAMALLGVKAVLLVYPKVAVISTTSLTVKSYFLTAVFLMSWVIFMAWSFSFLADSPDLTDDHAVLWIEIVVLSILTAVSMFFLTMTMARR